MENPARKKGIREITASVKDQLQTSGILPKSFFSLWGKFLVVGLAALTVFGINVSSSARTFVEARGAAPETISFLEKPPTSFFIEGDSFFLDTTGFTQPVSFSLFDEDVFEVLPETKLQGSFADAQEGMFPKTLLHLTKGALIAYRLSSLPETQIFYGDEAVMQGEGIVKVSEKDITAFRYPVIAALIRRPDFQNIKRHAWQSFFDETLKLQVIFPETDTDEAKAILRKDGELRRQKIIREEKEIRDEGFHFASPESLRFSLAKGNIMLAKLFSFRKAVEKKRVDGLFERAFQDSAFAFLLRDPEDGKKRFQAAFSVSQVPSSGAGRIAKTHSYAVSGHPWYDLNNEIRGHFLSQKDFDDLESRELMFELLVSGINRYFDLKTQNALIVFAEELKNSGNFTVLRLFREFFESLIASSDFFTARYLQAVTGLQDALREGGFYDFRKTWFEEGKRFLESNRLPLETGREALLFLLGEMGEERDKMLQKHGLFITFLFSPEAESAGAKKFREQFDAFLAREEETKKIQSIIGTKKQEDEKVRGFTDLEREIVSDFSERGINIISFSPPERDPRYVQIIEAELSGLSFGAKYDVFQKIFSDIRVGGEIYERSIALQNIKTFLTAVGKIQSPEEIFLTEEPDSSAGLSRLERVLYAQVFEKLDLLRIDYKKENIELLDEEEGRFAVRGASFKPDASTTVTLNFEFFNMRNEVSRVLIETPAGEIPIEETFSLSRLKDRAVLLYNRAKADKEREEESEREAETETAPIDEVL